MSDFGLVSFFFDVFSWNRLFCWLRAIILWEGDIFADVYYYFSARFTILVVYIWEPSFFFSFETLFFSTTIFSGFFALILLAVGELIWIDFYIGGLEGLGDIMIDDGIGLVLGILFMTDIYFF